MKLYPLLLLPLAVFTHHPAGAPHLPSPFFPENTDTMVISHTLDGNTAEWPDEKFEKDKETNISYAADNDGARFFVAMRIPDFPEQMKLMRMGMRFFIDLKGKKKENMGIEFPVRHETQEGSGFGGGRPASGDEESGEQRRFDPKAMRASLMLNMISMNIFGFVNQDEPKSQGLMMNGLANIAYGWDSSDVMHIEYSIPLGQIEEIPALSAKQISIGWKINGMDLPASGGTTAGPPGGFSGGRNTGGRSGGGRSGGGNTRTPTGSTTNTNSDSNRGGFEKMMKEQTIWTKYTFVIPAPVKGF